MEITQGASSMSPADDADTELTELLSLRSDSVLRSKSRNPGSAVKPRDRSHPDREMDFNTNGNNPTNLESVTNGLADAREDDSGESSDSDGEEQRKAPNQLMMEFLDCMMKQDTENSLKLCKMILIYEPNNAKALQFLPLLEEKQRLDAESDESGESDEGSETDDDSEDDDSDESDESSEDDDKHSGPKSE